MRSLLALALLLLATPASARSPSDDDAWRAHHRRGVILFDLARYDEAIVEFEHAYQIRNDPVNLFEIAESQRFARRYREAARFYNTYLLRAPRATHRAEAATQLVEMEQLAGEQDRAAAPDAIVEAAR